MKESVESLVIELTDKKIESLEQEDISHIKDNLPKIDFYTISLFIIKAHPELAIFYRPFESEILSDSNFGGSAFISKSKMLYNVVVSTNWSIGFYSSLKATRKAGYVKNNLLYLFFMPGPDSEKIILDVYQLGTGLLTREDHNLNSAFFERFSNSLSAETILCHDEIQPLLKRFTERKTYTH